MELKDFLKRRLLGFLLIQAGITISIGVIGLLMPSAKGLSPVAFFMPFIYALFCVLPSFVTYSRKELSIKQTIIRKVIEFILIEAVILLISYLIGALINSFMWVAIAISVAVIYIGNTLISYFILKNDAQAMTKKLRNLKKNNSED